MKRNGILYLVTDRQLCGDRSLEKIVESAIQGGVNLVQLREKNIAIKAFLQLGERLKEILKSYKVPLIINDRIDIALLLDADGVHLGQSDMPYKIARKILGPNKIIGLTINTFAQAEQAESWDVNYLGISPIFNTNTKPDVGTSWSLRDLKSLRTLSRHVLIGIGGINVGNVCTVMSTGLNGIAVVSAICAAPDPKMSALQLLQKMESVK